jgi:hypothetical protein
MFKYLMIVLCIFCIGAKTTQAYRHFHQAAQASTPLNSPGGVACRTAPTDTTSSIVSRLSRSTLRCFR